MPNVNFYPGGGRSPLGGQVNQIPYITARRDAITTPASARYKFAADMVRALTAKAQENREREDRDAYMAALAKEKEFDPSTMPAPEESNLLAGEREIMAQALLAGEPSLGGSALKSFPLFTASQGLIRPNVDDDPRVAEMFSDGASDRYESIERAASEGIPTGYAASPPLGTDESMIPPPYAEGFSGGPEALFGADGASDPRMQAALIGDIGTRAGDLQRHEDELKAAEANFVGREEAMAAYAPTTKYGEKLKYGYQVDQVERDIVEREAEDERDRAADLLSRERMFKAKTAEDLAIANLVKTGVTASSGTGASSNMKDHEHWAKLSQNVADAIKIHGPESPEAKAAISSLETFEAFAVTPTMANVGDRYALLSKVGRSAGGANIKLGPTEEQKYIYTKHFGEKNADLAAIRDNTLYDKVESAQKVSDKVGLMLARLDTMDAEFGGRLQDWKTALNSIVAEFGGEAAMQDATDAQFMAALQGSTVFELLKILGIGARGLDTPAEREFLQEVIAGRNTLTHGALVRMALGRVTQSNDIYQQWNDRTEDGTLRAWHDSNNRQEKIYAANIFLPKGADEEDVTNTMKQLEAQDRPSRRDDAIAHLYELRRRHRAEKKELEEG
jgi:hypothetical protein